MFVELPEPGRDVTEGEAVRRRGEREGRQRRLCSRSPARITETNPGTSSDDPAKVNGEAEGERLVLQAWTLSGPRSGFDALMDEPAYKAMLESL